LAVFVALIMQEVRTEGEGSAGGGHRARRGKDRMEEEDRSGDEWSSGRS
jgi:hypothetical protein